MAEGKVSPALRVLASQPAVLSLDVLVTFHGPGGDWGTSASGPTARAATLARTRADVEARLARHGARVLRRYVHIPVLHATLPTTALWSLAADDLVAGIGPNGRKQLLDAEGEGLIGARALREQGYTGAGVTVAVIDTGIDYGHPDLPEGTKTILLADTADRDGDPRDAIGHGTSVAGVIAGLSTGVAPGARVAAVQVLTPTSSGSDADILAGIDAVLESVASGNPYNIRVANLSLGSYFVNGTPPAPGPCDVPAYDYKAAFDALLNANVLPVAAAGNGGCTTGIATPACVSSALAVGAVYDADLGSLSYPRNQCMLTGCSDDARAGRISCFSDSGDRLDVLAPAQCATTTTLRGGYNPCFGGTSAAAAYVSGLAALLAHAAPDRSARELGDALRETGTPVTDPRNGITRNLVDGSAALERLRQPSPGTFAEALLVPIVLDVEGRGGSRFTTELTLGNRGSAPAVAELVYTAATAALGATGSGRTSLSLAPGEERVIADAVAWLRESQGLAIPPGPGQGGTLRVTFRGLSERSAAFAVARTTSEVCGGRAGLAYPGLSPEQLTTGAAVLFGLRETPEDRTNLALVNAAASGPVTLRVTLISGERGATHRYVVPTAVTPSLEPGEWRQIDSSQLLRAAGFSNAWALVERTAGTGPFVAYAVFNDNVTNDGSFVPAEPLERPESPLVLPGLVETPAFRSELILCNPSDRAVTAMLTYVESLGEPRGSRISFGEELAPGEQKVVPEAVAWLRKRGLPLGPAGSGSFAGALQVAFVDAGGAPIPGLAAARTAAPAGADCAGGEGSFGLFYPALSVAASAREEAWVTALAQTQSVRSNLALVNASDSAPVSLRVDVFDGLTGRLAWKSGPLELGPLGWAQLDRVLAGAGVTAGIARVYRESGEGRFLVYGVLNDGARPGERTGDGAYLSMSAARWRLIYRPAT